MENYKKGRNVEEPENWNSFGISWAGVNDEEAIKINYITGRTDPKSILKDLRKEYKEKEVLALSGFGPFASRAISIAEELKKIKRDGQSKHYQYNHISIKRFEEYWDPVFKDDDLEPLCVVREVPRISIVLSRAPLEECSVETPQISGLKNFQAFFNDESSSDQRNRRRNSRAKHHSSNNKRSSGKANTQGKD